MNRKARILLVNLPVVRIFPEMNHEPRVGKVQRQDCWF